MVQSCQNYAQTVAHVHGHKRLDADATENMKPHLRLEREAAFATSWEYVTVLGLKGLKCAVVCYFEGRIFNPTNLLNHVASSIELIMQI